MDSPSCWLLQKGPAKWPHLIRDSGPLQQQEEGATSESPKLLLEWSRPTISAVWMDQSSGLGEYTGEAAISHPDGCFQAQPAWEAEHLGFAYCVTE